MSRSKKTNTESPKPESKNSKKAVKPAVEKAPRPSGLNAAVTVLSTAKEPMHVHAITEQAMAAGIWTPKGKTPAATMYSAMIREIADKGKDARFVKAARGTFALAKVA
jgi:DsbC/DsbD-like thiol-disulfide interchange protein